MSSPWFARMVSRLAGLRDEFAVGRLELTGVLVVLLLPCPVIGHEGHDHSEQAKPVPAVVAPSASVAKAGGPAVEGQGSTARVEAEIARWAAQTAARPDDAAAWLVLGDSLMQRSRDRAVPGILDRAEVAYRRVAEIEPGNPKALVGLGWVANTRHDFDAGRRWLKQALEKDPHLPDAHALLGDAAVEAGDYDEALDHYQLALDQRPDLASYARAAHLLWLTGQPARARVLMEKAIAAGSPHAENVAWCRAELARMLFQDGALIPAETLLRQAMAQTPENPHVLAAMGRLRMARKDYVGAIELYERAAALLPQHGSLAALVDLHTWTGQAEKARRATERLWEFHENHEHDYGDPGPASQDPAGSAHANSPTASTGPTPSHVHGDAELAGFLADHDLDLDRALAEAEAAYRAYPNVAVTDTLAWCHYRKGRLTEARRFIQRALRWGTPDARLLYHAGMIHAGLGETAKARKYLYQALSLNPLFHPVDAETATKTLRELGSREVAEVPTRRSTEELPPGKSP